MNGKLRVLRKQLMTHKAIIRMSSHTKRRMDKRGYTKSDIVVCLMSGQVTEMGYGYSHRLKKMTLNLVIEGRDSDHNPMVTIVGLDGETEYTIVTVHPPIDRTRFKNCI